MQNKYVGDIGDFLKYGLLDFLFNNQNNKLKLRLGVNWYLVPNDGERNEKAYKYLNQGNKFSKSLEKCNPRLYDQMYGMKSSGKRTIEEVEKSGILPKGTIFFSDSVNFNYVLPCEREQKRASWHEKALKKLDMADIIFLDPDNAIQTDNIKSSQKKSIKYVLYPEVQDYLKRGKSLIIYNHRSMQKKQYYMERFEKISIKKQTKHLLRAHRYTARDFLFLVQPKHKTFSEKSLSDFLNLDWKRHFQQLY